MASAFEIRFIYDEKARLWDVKAIGAATPLEALQGFTAVLLTCRQAIPDPKANRAELQPDGTYSISNGVRPPVRP